MLDKIVAALNRQDHRAAADLLREQLKQTPDDPWVKLYLGRLQEISGKPKAAEGIYRQLLRDSRNAKLIDQARQGLHRLETHAKQQREQAIAQATSTDQAPGFLILEAIANDQRLDLSKRFAQVMQTDPYTARSILPSKGWRLYRAGPIGELSFHGTELKKVDIPAFWATLSDLKQISVFHVNHFQTIRPKVTVLCRNPNKQQGIVQFNWTEVSQRVTGYLPLFSQVIDLGYRDRLEWKEHIEDYTHICDLHLPQRRCILRIHDNSYDFHQGMTAISQHDTIRLRWNELMANLTAHLPHAPTWADFTTFAETTTDFQTPMSRLPAHMPIPRASDYYYDAAFHLYSSLALLRSHRAGLPQ